jgi:hypothetical protein
MKRIYNFAKNLVFKKKLWGRERGERAGKRNGPNNVCTHE